MRLLAALLLVCFLAPANAGIPEVDPNSCVISCPAATAYAGLGGSVTCEAKLGVVAYCQCTDPDRKMAGCEPIRTASEAASNDPERDERLPEPR